MRRITRVNIIVKMRPTLLLASSSAPIVKWQLFMLFLISMFVATIHKTVDLSVSMGAVHAVQSYCHYSWSLMYVDGCHSTIFTHRVRYVLFWLVHWGWNAMIRRVRSMCLRCKMYVMFRINVMFNYQDWIAVPGSPICWIMLWGMGLFRSHVS